MTRKEQQRESGNDEEGAKKKKDEKKRVKDEKVATENGYVDKTEVEEVDQESETG